jgi:hypothetical protein
VGYSDSPTITFQPLSGSGLIKSLETPLELTLLLNYAFEFYQAKPEDIYMYFSAINNAPDRAGPAGKPYRRRAEALSELLQLGCRFGQRRILYPRHEPFPATGIDARAYVDAAKHGLYFIDPLGDGRLSVASKHLLPGLIVPDSDNPEIAERLRILDVEPGKEFYFLRPPTQLQVPDSLWSPLPDGRVVESIYAVPRSVLSVMNIAAKKVEIPEVHAQGGVAPPLSSLSVNTSVDVPMRIKVSRSEPADLYRISHRGHWFYVDDTDHVSKQTFWTIVYSYTLSMGVKVDKDAAPVLALPIGGS